MKKILSILNIEFLINDNSFKNWRIILYLSSLALVMIASGHGADRKIFQIAKQNEVIKMLKSEFIERRTNLMNLKMETKIISELRPLGIEPAKTPPIKIIISKD